MAVPEAYVPEALPRQLVKLAPTDRYHNDSGDLILGTGEKAHRWFGPMEPEWVIKPFVRLSLLHAHPARGMEMLGISASTFLEDTTYIDGVMGNRCYGAMRVAILTDDLSRYNFLDIQTKRPEWFDYKLLRHFDEEKVFDLNREQRYMMGPGFTEFCSSDDGSSEIIELMARLDNGDRVLCHVWEWYSK